MPCLAEAGIPITGCHEARDVLNAAADLVDMNKSHFDHSIWQHMSLAPAFEPNKTMLQPQVRSRTEASGLILPPYGAQPKDVSRARRT